MAEWNHITQACAEIAIGFGVSQRLPGQLNGYVVGVGEKQAKLFVPEGDGGRKAYVHQAKHIPGVGCQHSSSQPGKAPDQTLDSWIREVYIETVGN